MPDIWVCAPNLPLNYQYFLVEQYHYARLSYCVVGQIEDCNKAIVPIQWCSYESINSPTTTFSKQAKNDF